MGANRVAGLSIFRLTAVPVLAHLSSGHGRTVNTAEEGVQRWSHAEQQRPRHQEGGKSGAQAREAEGLAIHDSPEIRGERERFNVTPSASTNLANLAERSDSLPQVCTELEGRGFQ